MTKRPGLILLAALVLSGLGYGAYRLGRTLQGAPELHGTHLQTPVAVGDLQLENGSGGELALGDFSGGYTLVFFGYTRCPDVCPLTLARVAQVYRELGDPEDVRVVMITVDPANDTPEMVQRYASGFHPDFVGLGGSASAVAEAAKAFYVGFQVSGQEVAHTDALFIVNPRSQLELVYSQANLRYLQEDLQVLLDER